MKLTSPSFILYTCLLVLLTELLYSQNLHEFTNTQDEFAISEPDFIGNKVAEKYSAKYTSLQNVCKQHQIHISQLDSVLQYFHNDEYDIWNTYSKTDYSYDANNNSILELVYRWNSFWSVWDEHRKYQYEFDALNRITKYIHCNKENATAPWYIFDQDDWSYDSNGNLIEYINSSSLYLKSSSLHYEDLNTLMKEEYTYDDNNNLTKYIRSTINYSTMQLEVYRWEERLYNADNNLVETVNYETYQTGDINIPSYRILYNYDANQEISNYSHQAWSKENELWNNTSLTSYTRNSSNLISISLFQTWDIEAQNWQDISKTEYTYNEDTLFTSKYEYELNDFDEWYAIGKEIFTFDDNGNLILWVDSLYRGGDPLYIVLTKQELSYNPKNQLLKRTAYEASTGNLYNLTIDFQQDFSYDTFDNLIDFTYSYFHPLFGELIPVTKHGYTYNSNYLLKDILYPSSVHSTLVQNTNNMILDHTEYSWNQLHEECVGYIKHEYCYAEVDTSLLYITERHNTSPNPAIDRVTFNYPEVDGCLVEIYDLSGKLLMSQELNMNRTMMLQGLKAGFYIYKINDARQSSGTLIVK